MNQKLLSQTVTGLFANSKGLLAMDESTPTCNKRLEAIGVPQTEEYRRKWRELIVTTKGLEESIGGAILYDETIRQKTSDGTPMINKLKEKGIIPGIKVDKGAKVLEALNGEKITEGLDGLRERLKEYFDMGARFAKWRAVFKIGNGTPSRGCIEANAVQLAIYASLCQEAGLVPIVEPEVLMDGDHDLRVCFTVTEGVLQIVLEQLHLQNVIPEYTILKPNMIIGGLAGIKKDSIIEVAEATLKCLLQSVPPAFGGIAFLSGGQSAEDATAHLNAMHLNKNKFLPWPLSFSFARAIQQPAMELWKGEDSNIQQAQHVLFHRAQCDRAARMGTCTPEIKKGK